MSALKIFVNGVFTPTPNPNPVPTEDNPFVDEQGFRELTQLRETANALSASDFNAQQRLILDNFEKMV